MGGILAYFPFFHGAALSGIFIKGGETAVLNASAELLKATSIEYFILSIAYCFTGYFNGVERTAFVMAQGLLSIFLVKIPYAYLASQKPNPQLFDIGLSTAYTAAFSLAACLIYYFYLRRKDAAAKEKQRA